ncbi:hypothetical protein BDQ12DRAFT_598807 [Crucibulum laeve]|uniref:Glycosyl transferase CAP10 domain-containing protein n=1 Tax=Crucibulum laeve TaxID=68775 RepID=A0A5C3M9R4_9AGAR|nr:hypothetical protein BDQ12DRAFT_598807 [Crucibulum laeve]
MSNVVHIESYLGAVDPLSSRYAWNSFTDDILNRGHGQIRLNQPQDKTRPDSLRAGSLEKHTYRVDGLLDVNPNGQHPIIELIRDAEESWQKKLDGASKTLSQAVKEYQRRYSRPPPKGFDKWWKYAADNDVQLPDEYDMIVRDLEPFWGIDPVELQKVQEAQENVTDSFTLAKNATGTVDLVKTAFSDPETWRQRGLLRGKDEILDLLRPVEELLSPFRAIFSPHDNPNLLSDYHVKKAAIDAARDRETLKLSDIPRVQHLGFASACPPGSPSRRENVPVDQHHRPPPRTGKTFIHDHRLSMDPCSHPTIFYNHAQYVAHDLGPRPQPTLAAQFAYCSTPLYHDLQTPSFIAWVKDVEPRENLVEWEDKTDERLMWRGSNTGMNHDASTRWRYAQRIQLVRWANQMNGTEQVLMETGEGVRVGEGKVLKKAIVNPAMMDIAFTGTPLGCDPETCKYLKKIFEWRRSQDPNGKEAGNHKYVVDVDGNGWSSRFKRLITSNSVVFKATAYPEWWLDRVQPWVHYVPVQVDYSDLFDAYVFFRGDVYGEGNHDDLARKIAAAGRNWSKAYWRKEDMTAYFYRMFLEYARVMSLDRDSMNYIPT